MVAVVLAQQVSLESAQATFTKLEKAIGPITPEEFLSLKSDTLKKIGFCPICPMICINASINYLGADVFLLLIDYFL